MLYRGQMITDQSDPKLYDVSILFASISLWATQNLLKIHSDKSRLRAPLNSFPTSVI
jgi:hypothetical protein